MDHDGQRSFIYMTRADSDVMTDRRKGKFRCRCCGAGSGEERTIGALADERDPSVDGDESLLSPTGSQPWFTHASLRARA
jgi:hypothetical protein